MVAAKDVSKGAAHKPAASKPTGPVAKPVVSSTQANTPAIAAQAAVESAKPSNAIANAATLAKPDSGAKSDAPGTVPPRDEVKLGVKLRRKADLIAALREGGTLVLTAEGLYRIETANGAAHPASKRRAASLIAQGLVKLTKSDNGKHYVLDPDAEKPSANESSNAAGTVASGTAPVTAPSGN